ncbi:MAG TPA: hypothetical protein PK843_01535 [bacterium]|nr:hypothetical protein [bacterium]
MEMEEHVHQDDPKVGPVDVITNPPGTGYFFIGNGHILGAVQVCTTDALTTIGLLLMSPDRFGQKRHALSMDPQNGLRATQVEVIIGPYRFRPDPKTVESRWDRLDGAPVAQVIWSSLTFTLCEIFYCPDRTAPRLIRKLHFISLSEEDQTLQIETGLLQTSLAETVHLRARQSVDLYLAYDLIHEQETWTVQLTMVDSAPVDSSATAFWASLTAASFDSSPLDHLMQTASICLQNVISSKGLVDASIWQYNLEWVRDHSMMVFGLLMSGNYPLARTLLTRLLTDFVSEDGDTVDSGRRRSYQDIELDQNGVLLMAVKAYVDYTGDLDLARTFWDKIEKTADFPLQRVFQHKESGLLHNQREFWERHKAFGIREGMELAYQLYVSMGLASAADLARRLDKNKQREKWLAESERIKQAMLNDAKYRLIAHGHFIKRRQMNGEVQSEIQLHPSVTLSAGMPLAEAPPHFLNPDSSISLPIAWEFIDPKGELARNSLFQTERLWNQRWSIGGYGRYHVSSEIDSPGPWPFASLFIARAYFEHGQDDKVWRVLNWLNTLTGAASGSWFEFYGPRPWVPPCPQVGITPWTWAEILLFFVHHLLGVRPEENQVRLRPRLLSNTERMSAALTLQGCRIQLDVQRAPADEPPSCRVDGKQVPYQLDQGVIVTLKNYSSRAIQIHQ